MQIESRLPNKKLISFEDLSPDEQLSVVQEIKDRESSWESAICGKKEIIREIRKAWYAGIGGYEYEELQLNEDSLLEIPMLYTQIESITSQIVNVLFPSGDDFFDLYPQAKNDMQFTDRAKRLMLHFVRLMKYRERMVPIVRTWLRDGIACLKVKWLTDKQWVRINSREPIENTKLDMFGNPVPIKDENGNPKVDPITGMPLYETEITDYLEMVTEEVRTFKDQPELNNVDVLNLVINPLSKTWEDADVIEKSYVSYEYLLDQNETSEEPVYYNLDELEDQEKDEERSTGDTTTYLTNEYDPLSQRYYATTGDGGEVTTDNIQTKENIEIWEYFGDIPFTRDNGDYIVLRNYYAVLGGKNQTLIKLEPSPYTFDGMSKKHPYIFAGCVTDSDYIMRSRGVCDTIIPIQKHLNSITKAVVAITERRARGRWECIDGEIDEETIDTLEHSTSGVFSVPYHGAIRPFEEPNNYTPQLEILKFYKAEATEASGATPVVTGQVDKTRRTAKEQILRAEALSNKMKMLLINLDSFMNASLLAIYELCKVCVSDSVWIRLNEDFETSFEQIKAWELEKNSYDFKIYTITEAINRSDMIENLMQYEDMIQKIGLQGQVDQLYIAKQIARSLKLPTEGLITPEPMIPKSQVDQQIQQITQQYQQQLEQMQLQLMGVTPQQAQQLMQIQGMVPQQSQQQGAPNANQTR